MNRIISWVRVRVKVKVNPNPRNQFTIAIHLFVQAVVAHLTSNTSPYDKQLLKEAEKWPCPFTREGQRVHIKSSLWQQAPSPTRPKVSHGGHRSLCCPYGRVLRKSLICQDAL